MNRRTRVTPSRRRWWRREGAAWLARRRRAGRTERGGGPVEFAVLASGMLALAFMIIQAGLVYHAKSVALAAATQGVNVARGYGNTPAEGEAHAREFLADVGAGLRQSEVRSSVENVNGEAVVITVTGKALSVLPGFDFSVEQSARGSVEEFVN
jgi:Flp pilus assembly protein TadG